MKKSILFLFAILFANLMSGQSIISDKSLSETPQLQSEMNPINPNPLYVVVVDSVNIKLENFGDYDINPKWIESMDVFTDANSKRFTETTRVLSLFILKRNTAKKF